MVFFEMCKLIAECPNVVPTGIGNSESEIIMDSPVMGDGRETQNEQTSTEMLGNFDVDVDEDNSEDDDGSGKGTTKSTNKSVTEASQKTGARPGTSKPATCTPNEWTKKRKVSDFVELVGAEEMTRQKKLKVAKARAEVDKAKLEARKAEMAYKTQKLVDKATKRLEGESQGKGYEAATSCASSATGFFDFRLWRTNLLFVYALHSTTHVSACIFLPTDY
jgi:hypothetical protein